MSGDQTILFWYLNDEKIYSWSGNLNYQFHIIANFGITGGSLCAFSPGPDNTTPFSCDF